MELTLTPHRHAAALRLHLYAWRCTQLVERSDEYLYTGGAYCNDIEQ